MTDQKILLKTGVTQNVLQGIKIALLGACAKNCDFKMLSLYNSESLTESKIEKFVQKIEAKL